MQMDEALQVRLQVIRSHARDGDAVVMAEFDHRIANGAPVACLAVPPWPKTAGPPVA
jgi:hypothetical protein